MISKTVVVFGNNTVLTGARTERDTGLPVVAFSDFQRDISGEDLASLDATLCDTVEILVGSKHAAQNLVDTFNKVLEVWDKMEPEE